VRLHAAADALKSEMGAPLSSPEQFIAERYLAPAGEQLARDVCRRARAEGAAMSLDEAVSYALGEA
jgi:hypothetical protein